MATEPKPVFIAGAARSGTSYLHALLNEHPGIRLSYESRMFLEGFACYRQHNDLDLPEGFNTFLDELIALEGEEKNSPMIRSIDHNRKHLFESHCIHSSFSGLIREIFTAEGNLCCFGNKMLRAELCPEILQIWPDARFLLLLRDPRAVVSSQLKRFKRRRLPYAAIYCDIHFNWALRLAADRERYRLLSYEAFMHNPGSELRQILEFCGAWDPFHAENMLARKPVFPSRLEKWRTLLTPDQVKRIEGYCYNSMQKAGYQPEHATRQRKISSAEKLIEIGFEKRKDLLGSPDALRRKNLITRLSKMLRS